jgi:hypothetical protein
MQIGQEAEGSLMIQDDPTTRDEDANPKRRASIDQSQAPEPKKSRSGTDDDYTRIIEDNLSERWMKDLRVDFLKAINPANSNSQRSTSAIMFASLYVSQTLDDDQRVKYRDKISSSSQLVRSLDNCKSQRSFRPLLKYLGVYRFWTKYTLLMASQRAKKVQVGRRPLLTNQAIRFPAQQFIVSCVASY